MSEGSSRSWLGRAGVLAWAVLGIAGVLVLVGFVTTRLSLIAIPLVLALFPATLLAPVAAKLKAWGTPDSLAALASMLLALLVVGGIIGAMVPLVAADFPELVESASSGIEEIEALLEGDPFGVGIDGPNDLFEAARDVLGEVGEYVDQAVSAGTAVLRMLAGLLLLTVILFFYLKDGRSLVDGLLRAVPARHRPRWNASADVAWETLGLYFRGQLLVAFADATFIGIGLLILGIPLALPLAVLIFFGALFPLIGAILTGVLAVLVALADGGLVAGLLVLGLIVAVQQLEGNVLQPYIQSRAIQLHPLVVLLSVTAGSLLLGVLGAFVAVPAVAVVARIIGTATAPRGSEAPDRSPAEHDDEEPHHPAPSDQGNEGEGPEPPA
ncbi:MAG: AI-2E family transporter [Nitriliruptoraceae bacterium]